MTALQLLIIGAAFAFISIGIEDKTEENTIVNITAILGICFLFAAAFKIGVNLLGVMLK